MPTKYSIQQSVNNQKHRLVKACMMLVLLVMGSVVPVSAQRTIGVAPGYEDSLRIVILTNVMTNPGDTTNCANMQNPCKQTRDTVLRAIGMVWVDSSGTRVLRKNPLDAACRIKAVNVRALDNRTVTWAQIKQLWGANNLPHVIVHVNGGWGSYNDSLNLSRVLDSAMANYIGVTDIGDDASWIAMSTFGLRSVNNKPAPMLDATQLRASDSLFVGLHPKIDVVNDSTDYPNLKGLTKNAARLLNGDSILYFKPYRPYTTAPYDLNARCQADADKYTILANYKNKLAMLGYQNARITPPTNRDSLLIPRKYVNGFDTNELDVIVAIQDTVPSGTSVVIRRGVMLSIEPQFLKNGPVSQQIVYDAILYGSLSWQNRPAAGINLALSGDTVLRAGDTLKLTASVYDAVGKLHPEYGDSVQWSLLPQGTASYMQKTGKGATNAFIAIDAYMSYKLIASYIDIKTSRFVADTVTVRVIPNIATHVVIEASPDSTISLRDDAPLLPKPSTLTMTGTTNADSLYAVLRDAYGNWVGHASGTLWRSRNIAVVSVPINGGPNQSIGECIVTRVGDTGTTYITATTSGTGYKDSVRCILNRINYSQIHIYVVSGGVVPIDTLSMRTDQDTTLHIRGLRFGTTKWDDIQADWFSSENFQLDNPAPSGSPTWTFNPLATDTGFISASYVSNGTTLHDTIKVAFKDGLPFSMTLYPKTGAPGPANVAYPPSVICTAGVALPVVAKMFDTKGKWLGSYETSTAPFTWTVTEMSGTGSTGSLSAFSGFQTSFTARKAYNTVQITARFVNGAVDTQQTLLVYVVPGKPTHLVLEGDTARGASPNADNPLAGVTIGATDTSGYAYAILRDQFGNWVDYSQHTEWHSFDTTKAVAYTKDPTIGQGIITRISDGSTFVSARDSVNSGSAFIDTIPVTMSNIYYTALRIVVRDSVHISTLIMGTDQDTLISVVGRRSDNPSRWSPVPGNWSIAPVIDLSSAVPSASSSWRFSPNDTGLCKISVSYSTATPDTISVLFKRGVANKIVLYPKAGTPDSTTPYPTSSTAITDTAGKIIPLVAKIFDKKGAWLQQYEGTAGATRISWKIVELTGNPPTGSLSSTSGAITSYTPTRAYNTLYVVATFDSTGISSFSDTIQVKVVPGVPARLVIEGDPNWPSFKNAANPLDSILIDTNNTTYSDAYAMLRDAYGNYVSYSLNTGWVSTDSTGTINPDVSLISVQNGAYSIGQGIITRVGTNGWAKVIAADRDYPTLMDTVKVFVRKYRYDSLRIVVGTAPTLIDSLTMSTNADTTLKVQGHRTDTRAWEYVAAKWDVTPGLLMTPAAPNSSSKWTFSPDTSGLGWIRVSMPNDSTTRKDSIRVRFINGDATSLSLQVLTPLQLRNAGDTIVAVAKLSNRHGLLPGTIGVTAKLGDFLGQGGTIRPVPVVVVNGVSMNLATYLGTGTSAAATFVNGLDTIKYVLYFAPNITDSTTQTDSMQTLYISVGSLIANSGAFIVHPAKLATMTIKDVAGADVDTVKLDYPNGTKVLSAKAFDRFGNVYTLTSGANWSVTDSLHAIDNPLNTVNIYYTAKYVTGDESGYIKAKVTDTSSTVFTDSTYVIIKGPKAESNFTAITGDVNGNGYLDRVTVHFNRKTTLTRTFSVFDSIHVVNVNGTDTTVFYIDSVNGLPVDTSSGAVSRDTTDSIFVLSLEEKTAKGLQTDWRPVVSVKGIGGFDTLGFKTTDDGAGPVIETVYKKVTKADDPKTDVVDVTFSEPIVWVDGNPFKLSAAPGSVLSVWTRDATDSTLYYRDTLMLKTDSLTSFDKVTLNKTIEFTMSNGHKLSSNNYLSINTDTTRIIDQASVPNTANINNRKVKVSILNATQQQTTKLTIGPNPVSPVSGGQPIKFTHDPSARNIAAPNNHGTVISFTIPNAVKNDKVTGYVKVFDVTGNLVAYDESTFYLTDWPSDSISGSIKPVDIYWSGVNGQGMRAAPGVYRTIVSITTKGTKQKYTGTMGIRK